MRNRSLNAWVWVIFVTALLPLAAGENEVRTVPPFCTFSHRNNNGPSMWSLALEQRRSPPPVDNNILIYIMNTGKWPTVTPENGMGSPLLVDTPGRQNAAIDVPADGLFSEESGHPRAILVADFAWLRRLGEETGSRWLLETVLAHELGHLFHRHVFKGVGARDIEARRAAELEADQFAGYSVCRLTRENRLPASLSEVEVVFRTEMPEDPAPDDDHPGRSKRLKAVRAGWQEGGCPE